jgi:hypothetical protein
VKTIKTDELRTYLETFHGVYREKLKTYVPTEYCGHLLREHHLRGAKIVGYVSTTYGAGYEYQPGTPGETEVSYGSARADEFFLRCPRGVIQDDSQIFIRLLGHDFRMVNCRFEGRIPIRLDGIEASAILEALEWTFRGESRRIEFAEIFANRRSEFWTREKAVERAMDEVLQANVYASGMEHLRISMNDYLERFKKGHVLILGDFSEEGMSRIERIRAALYEQGYYGFTLKDVKEVPEYDLRQKLTAVAPVCRFIVVDDSSQAGHAAEIPVLEMLRVTTILLRLRGSRSTFVTRALDATSKVIQEAEYDSQSLEQVLGTSIQWAESVIDQLRNRYSREYPWRSPTTG